MGVGVSGPRADSSFLSRPLPTRDDLAKRASARHPRTTASILAAILMIVAIVSFLSLQTFLPKANIRISNVTVTESPCDPTTNMRTATATFDLTNSGGVGGNVYVGLYVDGRERAWENFYVPAGSTVRGRLDIFLSDCSYHRYSVVMRMPEPLTALTAALDPPALEREAFSASCGIPGHVPLQGCVGRPPPY